MNNFYFVLALAFTLPTLAKADSVAPSLQKEVDTAVAQSALQLAANGEKLTDLTLGKVAADGGKFGLNGRTSLDLAGAGVGVGSLAAGAVLYYAESTRTPKNDVPNVQSVGQGFSVGNSSFALGAYLISHAAGELTSYDLNNSKLDAFAANTADKVGRILQLSSAQRTAVAHGLSVKLTELAQNEIKTHQNGNHYWIPKDVKVNLLDLIKDMKDGDKPVLSLLQRNKIDMWNNFYKNKSPEQIGLTVQAYQAADIKEKVRLLEDANQTFGYHLGQGMASGGEAEALRKQIQANNQILAKLKASQDMGDAGDADGEEANSQPAK